MRDGQRRPGIPEHVDPERNRKFVANRSDDIGHGSDRREIGVEPVRAIVLVAEHDGVDSAGLKRIQIAADPFANPAHPVAGVVKGRSGQRRQVNHADHGLRFFGQLLQPIRSQRTITP